MINSDGNKVGFIVVGAGKGGTTWIWHMLRRHTAIFLPDIKEVNYFNRELPEPEGASNLAYKKPLEWYHSHFEDMLNKKLCGDISPTYLWSASAPKAIFDYNPNVKLIAILRDPVERTFSHFLYRQQKGYVGAMSFEHSIKKDAFMLERSKYGKHLSRYYELFSDSQIKIIFFDDMVNKPNELLKELQEFLDVHFEDLLESEAPVNATGSPKYPYITRIIGAVDAWSQATGTSTAIKSMAKSIGLTKYIKRIRAQTVPFQKKPKVSAETRAQLIETFLEDIVWVEHKTGRNLSSWKN